MSRDFAGDGVFFHYVNGFRREKNKQETCASMDTGTIPIIPDHHGFLSFEIILPPFQRLSLSLRSESTTWPQWRGRQRAGRAQRPTQWSAGWSWQPSQHRQPPRR